MRLKHNKKKKTFRESTVKMKKKTVINEPFLYQPPNSKFAHLFLSGFKGGVGKSFCGCTFFADAPLHIEIYPASIICKSCQHEFERRKP
jgi:hypothetical protein